MKRNLAHLSLLALVLCTRAHGAELSCPALNPEVQVDISEPTYDRRYGIQALTGFMSSKGRHSAHSNVTGFYDNTMSISGQALSNAQALGSPPEAIASCLTRFSINIAARPTIHLASEIKPGGCADQAVTAHEYNHHRIHLAQLYAALPLYMANNPLPRTPFLASNTNQRSQLVNAYTESYVTMLIQSIENFITPAQDAFDSPEEYRRISRLCPEEFNSIIRMNQQR
jgi:hypothetical protein